MIALIGGLSGLAILVVVLALTLGGGKPDGDGSQEAASYVESQAPAGWKVASYEESQAPPGWKVISVADFGVELMMPDSSEYRVKLIVEDGKRYLSRTHNGRIACRLECKRLGKMTPQDRQAALSKWVADSVHGWPTIHGRWEISIGETPGVAIQLSEEGAKLKTRCFIVGDRMISQMVFVLSGDYDTESTRRFLDSLRVDGLSVTHTPEWYSQSAR
jgi:hypothetical protein